MAAADGCGSGRGPVEQAVGGRVDPAAGDGRFASRADGRRGPWRVWRARGGGDGARLPRAWDLAGEPLVHPELDHDGQSDLSVLSNCLAGRCTGLGCRPRPALRGVAHHLRALFDGVRLSAVAVLRLNRGPAGVTSRLRRGSWRDLSARRAGGGVGVPPEAPRCRAAPGRSRLRRDVRPVAPGSQVLRYLLLAMPPLAVVIAA